METPLNIWNKYKKEECAYVDYIFTTKDFVWNYKVHSNIKCIMFEYCDRGIQDWSTFKTFLKTSFPNLEVLLLCQNYTYENENIEDMLNFLNDSWLQYIWIQDLQSNLKVNMQYGCSRMLNSCTFGCCSNCNYNYQEEYYDDDDDNKCMFCINSDNFFKIDRHTVQYGLYIDIRDIM